MCCFDVLCVTVPRWVMNFENKAIDVGGTGDKKLIINKWWPKHRGRKMWKSGGGGGGGGGGALSAREHFLVNHTFNLRAYYKVTLK